MTEGGNDGDGGCFGRGSSSKRCQGMVVIVMAVVSLIAVVVVGGNRG